MKKAIINKITKQQEIITLYERAITDLLFLFHKPDNMIPEFDERINRGGNLSWLHDKIKETTNKAQ
jgi:transcription initiation factor TFIID subunit TAF12